MKLLLVLEDLLTGGAQAHAVELARGLRARGWSVEALVLGSGVSAAHAERFGAGVQVLSQRGLKRPGEWRRLVRAIAERPADVVASVNQVAGCVVAAARLRGRLNAAVSILHSTDVRSRAGWLRTAPYLAAARAHGAVVFVSERQRAHWARRGLATARARVIRNGVDLRRFPPVSPGERVEARRRLGLDPQALVLGSAAMFRPEKNHRQMLDALAALRRDGAPAAALVLVGDGPTRPGLEAHARALGLGEAVRFCGERADVRPCLAAMDVGLLCSTSIETLPLFGLELMAGGAPLVASRVGGLEELVEDGEDGLLFPPGDTGALLRQLKRCADPALRARLAQGAARKAQGFTLETMVDGYAELFTAVAAGRA